MPSWAIQQLEESTLLFVHRHPEVLELERARARSEVEVSGKLTDHMDSASQQRLDEAFATFFFQTAIPFHIADCSSLRHLLSLARPAYKVPSRKLLATRLLDNAFEKQKTVIGKCIAESNVVALISDGWTNLRKEHLVNFVVTISNLKNKPVFIKSASTGEIQLTGHSIANIIKEVIAHIGVNKVTAVVTDNAANMRCLGYLRSRVFTHLLQWLCCSYF